MIWIGIEDNVIRVPHPITDITLVIGCDAEVETVKPEAARTTATEPPVMLGTKAAGEAAMRPRLFDPIVLIVAAGVVTDPNSAIVDMRGVGMVGLIAVISVFFGSTRRTTIGLGPTRWNRRAALSMIIGTLSAIVIGTLAQCRYQTNEQSCQCQGDGFHRFPPEP